MLKVMTAFSGGFGSIEFALKYEKIEHEIVAACEWLEPQRKSYLLNHGEPSSNFYKDIRDLDGKKYKGEIDLYHLSPPCQSYSMAGNRGGADDERGGLMFEAIKSIDEVQPKMFTIENVRGLLSSNGGEDWKNILKDVKSLKGYTITYGIMNAQDQGTPQNRERVFIIGFRGNAAMMPFPAIIKLDKCLADVLEDDVDKKYYLSDKMISCFKGHKDRHDAKGNGFGMKIKDINSHANCINTREGSRATDNFIVRANTKIGYEIAEKGDSLNLTFPNSKTRRGRVGKSVAQTLDTACNQAVIREPISRLTPRECARSQGDFDDMFKFGKASDTKLYEFIGNAMDISTTRNLLKAMFLHPVEFTEPQEPSFTIRELAVDTLF